MITKYGARNCWSFKEWMDIDFTINKNVPAEYGFSDIKILPALCFEGGNATGKTCALRVLSFIAHFCNLSFSYKPDEKILFDSFFDNDETSDFYVEFTSEHDAEDRYLVEFTIDCKKIHREKLSKIHKSKKTLLYERRNNEVKKNVFFNNITEITLRDNASFISTYHQYGIQEITEIVTFFKHITSNVSYGNVNVQDSEEFYAEVYWKYPEIKKRVVEELKRFDTGIMDFQVFPVTMHDGSKTYYTSFEHDTADGTKVLTYNSQSMGTRILYNILLEVFRTVHVGGVLLLDEIDTHLHSSIVPEIINYFLDDEINKNHAQLVFTSHDSALMNTMKKYRTYLFNKEQGESFCYRIDELPDNINVRNDRPLEQLYKSGILGGVPNVR